MDVRVCTSSPVGYVVCITLNWLSSKAAKTPVVVTHVLVQTHFVLFINTWIISCKLKTADMDLNAVFFMRPPLNAVYPFAPRDFHVLFRGKLPTMPPMSPEVQPPPAHTPVNKLSPVSPGPRSPDEIHELRHGLHHHPFRGLRRPSPHRHHNHPRPSPTPSPRNDQYEPFKRLAEVQLPRNPNKPLTNFSITDILNGEVTPKKIVRPWDDDQSSRATSSGDDNDEEIDVEETRPPSKKGVSPLDALFQMTSKTFDGQNSDGGQGTGELFSVNCL